MHFTYFTRKNRLLKAPDVLRMLGRINVYVRRMWVAALNHRRIRHTSRNWAKITKSPQQSKKHIRSVSNYFRLRWRALESVEPDTYSYWSSSSYCWSLSLSLYLSGTWPAKTICRDAERARDSPSSKPSKMNLGKAITLCSSGWPKAISQALRTQ